MSTKRKEPAPPPDSTVMQASDPQPVDPSSLWAGLDRGELRKQFAAGDLPELEFEAVVFCAVYPNWNFVRFRPEEMDAFAGSFVGVPFLRNHDMGDIGARDGLVLDAWMAGDAMHARIKLTTEEGIRDFLGGRIDRFSISWFRTGETQCSVCGKDWFGADCPHVPGESYLVKGETGNGTTVRCELVQVGPVGREISAVNVPASSGTQVLAELVSLKESLCAGALCKGCACAEAGKESFQEDPVETKAETKAEAKVDGEEVKETQALAVAPQVGAQTGGNSNATPAAAEEPHQPPQADGTGPALDELAADLVVVRDEMRSEVLAWREQVNRQKFEAALGASGLPQSAQAFIRRLVEPHIPDLDIQQLDNLVQAQRAALAEAAQPTVVKGMHPVMAREMRTGIDQIQEAMDWCLGVQGGPTPPPSMRNIRDVYLAITGDVDFYGVFNPDHSQLSAASTTTLPGLARNSLNKVVRQHYDNLATFRWYERIVDVVAHDGSTQDIDLIMVDGLANLPTVAEGAAYTEALAGDSRESMSFGKRGVYVGITLEMFRRSDIAKMQAIPRELVKAAIRTRSAAIAGIFSSNSGAGPTMLDDKTALFHADHGNLSTTAFSAGEWAAARKRVFGQTVPGTGSKLGLWPTFALLPVDLYDAALEAFGYGTGDVGKPNSGGTAQTVNPYGESRIGDPRPIPIVVPDWTDGTDWAQIVDPRLHPVVQMAYANAPQGGVHALPEIYEVRSETAGLMFTNDTLPIKIRDWWAYGVATWVGVAKNNVAS
ncbi:MAG: hypothetical protein U0X20_00315 [Caldilineaceae bacterium]